jgi:GDP-L-fucose synthase
MTRMHSSQKIFVAGHGGMVGSAVARRLTADGFENLLLPSRSSLDLTDQEAVDEFFRSNQPSHVFLCAARVGGIHANRTYPAQFLRDNLAIQTNVIHSAWKHGTRKLLFLGSSCIYPRDCPQPIREEFLLTGPLEPTNEAYAVAKIAGLKMCQAYRRQYGFDAICAMPTNLYGPGDNYHPDDSHVLAALIRRFRDAVADDAQEVAIWGDGSPLREFLHADDLAAALVFLMHHYSDETAINVGSGDEVSILALARMIADAAGYRGRIATDPDKPNGTPRKRLDSSRILAMGWRARISLHDGVTATYSHYRDAAAADTLAAGR